MIDPYLIAAIKTRAKTIEEITRAQTRLKNQMLAIIREEIARRDPAIAKSVKGDKDDAKVQRARNKLNRKARDVWKKIRAGQTDLVDPVVESLLLTFIEAHEMQRKKRKLMDRDVTKVCKSLPEPILTFVEETRGFNYVSLAHIIGAAGDLNNYETVSRLWKRMGLAVIDGERQRKIKDNKELAIQHGYSPSKRSILWNVGGCLMKSQIRSTKKKNDDDDDDNEPIIENVNPRYAIGPYGELYIERRAIESTRGLSSLKHEHNRAQRYIEKRFLRDLWRVWTGHNAIDTHSASARPHSTSIEQVAA